MRAKIRLLLPLVSIFSLAISLIALEACIRHLDGYSIAGLKLVRRSGTELQEESSLLDRALRHVEWLPVADGVERGWFLQTPPPLQNRRAVLPEFREIDQKLRKLGYPSSAEAFKLWNENFLRERACGGEAGFLERLHKAMGFVFSYQSRDLSPHPRFRLYPGVTLPTGLVSNQFGFRGPEIELVKPARSIRVAFIGASTTVNAHALAFSYPEFVGHWLKLWAQSRHADVRFEVINAGRSGFTSTDIAAMIRKELLQLQPDMAVYYEGSNQFSFKDLLDMPVSWPPPSEGAAGTEAGPGAYSAVARRIVRAIHFLGPRSGEEPKKPPYFLKWPEGIDENDPDLESDRLPVDLSTILSDLDNMRGALATIGSRLVLSSFVWMVEDALTLDLRRDANLHRYLNSGRFWPYRYRDMRRMADFQNRVLAKYASAHGLPFLDVAASVPREPAFFKDGVHMRQEGLRLRAWITLQQLIPLLANGLAEGRLPRRADRPADSMPEAISVLHHNLECDLPQEIVDAPQDEIYSLSLSSRPPNWKKIKTGTRAQVEGGRLLIESDLSRSDYQVVSIPIPLVPNRPYLVEFDMEVNKGKMALGVLDSKRNRWVIRRRLGAGYRGPFQLLFTAPSDRVQVVLRNDNESESRSSAILRRLAILRPMLAGEK